MSLNTTADAVLALLKSDLLTVAGKPLLAFLTAIEPASGAAPSVVTVAGAWIQLHGALLQAVPGIESEVAIQVIGVLQAKLEALMAQHVAASPTAATAAIAEPKKLGA